MTEAGTETAIETKTLATQSQILPIASTTLVWTWETAINSNTNNNSVGNTAIVTIWLMGMVMMTRTEMYLCTSNMFEFFDKITLAGNAASILAGSTPSTWR
jgi:hypothetical protein